MIDPVPQASHATNRVLVATYGHRPPFFATDWGFEAKPVDGCRN